VYAQPARIDVAHGPFSIQVLVQGPAETVTDLQVICLFRSSPENTLHGSLTEINEKMKGLLDQMRKPDSFRGDPGETLLITAPKNSIAARQLLVIGLGDSQSFSPQSMQLVGELLYTEAGRLGVTHPFFAPTILDGGVSKFATSEVAEQVIRGLMRADAIDRLLRDFHASSTTRVTGLTYLAGPKNVNSTLAGIEKAIVPAKK
jgi:hypothetical protein